MEVENSLSCVVFHKFRCIRFFLKGDEFITHRTVYVAAGDEERPVCVDGMDTIIIGNIDAHDILPLSGGLIFFQISKIFEHVLRAIKNPVGPVTIDNLSGPIGEFRDKHTADWTFILG